MKLLFDENLSRSLCSRLNDVFPGSEHAVVAGLEHASGTDVWDYAKRRGLIIVTKDGDFHQISFLRGAPPKVVWLRVGNASTGEIEKLLRGNLKSLTHLESDADAALLVIESD